MNVVSHIAYLSDEGMVSSLTTLKVQSDDSTTKHRGHVSWFFGSKSRDSSSYKILDPCSLSVTVISSPIGSPFFV